MREKRGETGSALDAGFTLMELMIVVAILGVLLAMCVANYARARENAQNSRYAADVQVAKNAFVEYSFVHGRYPPDVTPAVMPVGMRDYLARFPWFKPTSLGGKWDWDNGQFGEKAGVSVYMPSAKEPQLERLDALIDDGNLGSGNFRARASGYISVIE